MTDSVVVQQRTLESFFTWFPDFTDHSTLHSMDVLDFCNRLLGDQVAALFDIPSEVLTFAIAQLSRGHRKTDLHDEVEYPDIETPGGVIRTAFLSAVLRLADEIDVGADRNPEILFDTSKLTKQVDIDAFSTHESIRTVEVARDAIVLHVRPRAPRFAALVEDLAGKIQQTLDYCRDVAEKRSDLRITQEWVDIEQV